VIVGKPALVATNIASPAAAFVTLNGIGGVILVSRNIAHDSPFSASEGCASYHFQHLIGKSILHSIPEDENDKVTEYEQSRNPGNNHLPLHQAKGKDDGANGHQ
jgi:hypothetical protein